MSFLAGIVSRAGSLSFDRKRRFRDALDAMAHSLPWPLEWRIGDHSVLAQASFPHMWQGANLLMKERFEAVGIGVQWCKIPQPSALEYLAEALLSDAPEMDACFGQFVCGVYDKEKHRTVLCTDSVGTAAVYYAVYEDFMAFSSHQLWFGYFLGGDGEADRQGVLEYLIIGHLMGERSLLTDVKVLPAGARLFCYRDHWSVENPEARTTGDPNQEITEAETASEAVYEYLDRKCVSYSLLSEKPVAGFLSGGWDSRLLVAMFQNAGNMNRTYTSQQLLRFGNGILSEKKIATEAARFLGVKNEFVPPRYRIPENGIRRAQLADYATWFHDWAYALVEALPRDVYLFFDGLLGDILLRGLYITEDLDQYQMEEDREHAAEWFHARYMKGFNTYTKSAAQWESVIRPAVLGQFSSVLLEGISTELQRISEPDFVTLFLLRNRSRRGISVLPRFLWGSKGTVLFPFCDRGFLRLILSIPLRVRRDHSLYRNLLEKSRPGLSSIPSTNTTDPGILGKYLSDSIAQLTWQGRLSAGMARVPVVGAIYQSARKAVRKTNRIRWMEELVERPPYFLEDLLRPEIWGAIRGRKLNDLLPYRFFLERIIILGTYFS